jgi:Short-chain dehydrogenases of various substrate specificities
MKKKIVIIGATSAIAEECAREWLRKDHSSELVMVARSVERCSRIGNDLQIRYPQATITVVEATNFLDTVFINSLIEQTCASKTPDIILIAHGSLPEQKRCENDLELVTDAIEVNGLSPILFAEAYAHKLEMAGKGILAVIGSVAGDRGRKSNYVYGAAKGLVARYMQGLQHRFAGTAIQITLVKPGPTDTPMTSELKQKGAKLADPVSVAKQIVTGIEKGQKLIYVPVKWALIMMIIRHLPNCIFNKMDI